MSRIVRTAEREHERENGRGRLMRGDLRDVLPRLSASADLVYFDLPFGTGRVFPGYDDRPRELSRRRETSIDPRALSVLDLAEDADSRAWLEFLASCLVPIRAAARESATVWIHLDERRAHLARLLCDRLLRPARWRSTVVWSYRRWPSPARRFQATHDVLFVYAPESGGTFNVLRGEPSASTLATFGRRRQSAVLREGRRVRSELADEDSPGPPLGDVWEIPIVAPSGHERRDGANYPTQKPRELLRRIVESTSNPGDLVLDPACGSGTAIAAARDLGRRWIGIDSSEVAFAASARRLGAATSSNACPR